MISLGLGELVASSSLILRSFFGGEEGITTNRTKLLRVFGLNFGPQIEVYYLIAAWCLFGMLAMYALTRTPFGRMCNAVRENAERAQFVGYNPTMVRFIAFSLRRALRRRRRRARGNQFRDDQFRYRSAPSSRGRCCSPPISAASAIFIGPVIGAVLVTWLQVMLSDLTDVWQLYFGLLFIGVVMFAPNGIAGLVMRHEPLWQARAYGSLLRLALAYLIALGPALAAGRRPHRRHRDELPSQRQGIRGPDDLRLPPHAQHHERVAVAGNGGARGRRVPAVPPHLADRGRRLARCARRGAGRGEGEMTAPAIKLNDVHKSFGATRIIRGVSLTVPAGERHAIIGPNGAGKSTLFNLISGRLTAYLRQRSSCNGENVTGLAPYQINRRGLSRSFQVTNIFPRLSVWENVRCAVLWSLGYRYAFWRGIDGLADVRERTEHILAEIDLIDRRRVPAGVLTYAEQRALEIGITIAGGADIILLDEPSAGMSVAEAARAVTLIRRVSQGRTLIMIEHDMDVVFDLADRISVLVYGQIIASDVPASIKQDRAVQTAYLGTAA